MDLHAATPTKAPRDPRGPLLARLNHVRTRIRRLLLLEGLTWILGALVALGFAGLFFDWWLELSLPARRAYLFLGVSLVAFLFWRRVWQVVEMEFNPLDVAQGLDRAARSAPSDAITPRIASVLQMSDPNHHPQGESRDMTALAVQQNARFLEQIDFSDRINPRHLKQTLRIWAGLLLLPVAFSLVAPHAASLAAKRFLLGSNEAWPHSTTLSLVGLSDEGTLLVPRGEPNLLRIVVTDEDEPTERVSMQLARANGEKETVALARFAEGDFRYNLPPLQQPVEITLRGGDGRLGPVTIEPIDRPRIDNLTLTYQHQRDPQPVAHRFNQEEGNLRLLPDTRIELSWSVNVPVAETRILSDSFAAPTPSAPSEALPPIRFLASDNRPSSLNPTTPVSVLPPNDTRPFALAWNHNNAVTLKIELVSKRGGLVSYPVPVAVGLREDRPPSLRLTHSIVRQRVTAVATIPLKLAGRDDFGITSSSLHSRIQRNTALQDASTADASIAPALTNVATLYGPTVPAVETRVETQHNVELADIGMNPGDTILLHGEVDDDCFTGVQTTPSRTLSFRVVLPEELFREILVRQQQLRAQFRKAATQAEELRDALPSATLPDDAPALLRDHRFVQREVWQVHRALEASAEEMRYNRLGGEEALDLIERQVLNPMRQLHDLALTQQRDALESQRAANPASLEDIQTRQNEIVAEAERILKNMAQWDSFIDVVNQLNTIIKIEKNVNEETKALGEKQIESIFDN